MWRFQCSRQRRGRKLGRPSSTVPWSSGIRASEVIGASGLDHQARRSSNKASRSSSRATAAGADIDKSIGEWLAQRASLSSASTRCATSGPRRSPQMTSPPISALPFDEYGDEVRHRSLCHRSAISFGSDIMPDVCAFSCEKPSRTASASCPCWRWARTRIRSDRRRLHRRHTRPRAGHSVPLLHQLPLERTQCIYGEDEAKRTKPPARHPTRGGRAIASRAAIISTATTRKRQRPSGSGWRVRSRFPE